MKPPLLVRRCMSLPIDTVLPELRRRLAEHPTLVLQAPPGAGKTTRVPLALLAEPWMDGQRLLMLEPRRLAARAAAHFMAAQLVDEQGKEPVGKTVGYRTRMDSRVSSETRIEVVTEGVLTRMLQRDPALEGYAAVVFDEFHERSLQADLGLALVREVQQALRPDLRILVMSATLDGCRVAACLDDAPMLTSEGRSWPVTVFYRPVPPHQDWLDHLVAQLLSLVEQPDHGSLLVFLPGVAEIRRVQQRLEGRLPADVMLTPLYGDLSAAAQDEAMAPAVPGQRKLVLATAIAETSITIEGIGTVVDAGFDRRPRFDPVSGLTRLDTARVSRASADQRQGRAGRLGPGRCYRLWPESERLAEFARPEILDADLGPVVLELAQWGCRDPSTMVWLDPPPEAAWGQARDLLQQLAALDSQGAITQHGREILQIPLPPRLAHMLCRARGSGQRLLAAELAVLLSERDPLRKEEARHVGCDLSVRLEILRDNRRRESHWQNLRQLVKRLRLPADSDAATSVVASSSSIGKLLAWAYPDRIARRRPGSSPRYLLANGRGARLAEEDPLAMAPWLVAAQLEGGGREARIYLAAEIDDAALAEVCEDQLTETEEAGWDSQAMAVRGWKIRHLGAIVMSREPMSLPASEVVVAAMLAGIRELGLTILPWTPTLRQWQARVGWMAWSESVLGEANDGPERWPAVDDKTLLDTLENWAAPYMAGVYRADQLRHFPLTEALRALLTPAQQAALVVQLPEVVQVPSGSRIAIDYTASSGPVLAVKLQEMFGMQRLPVLASGRLSLTAHLLSPARRPLAVTADLASFWGQGYAEVRREMRGRYPRHPWPEDPLQAEPQRGVKRKPD